MSSYTPKDKWHPTIRQFDINEIVEGGSTGLDNIPHQQLADNLLHLEKRIAAIEGGGSTPPDTGGGDTGGDTGGGDTGGDTTPDVTIDIVGYKDGDYNASHFQGESLKVNLTNAQNGHEIYVMRSAEALNSNTTGGWGNDGSGIVKWGVADITGFHAKLHTAAHYQELAENMYTMTYIAIDNATKGTPQEARFLRKVRGKSWKKKPRAPYQANAAFYGFGETVKLTDDTVDIYFIASELTKAEAEGKELTISMFSSYSAPNPNGSGLPVSRKAGAGDIARAFVENGIAHFPNVPIPKLSEDLLEGEELKTINYEIGTPDIPYAGDGTGFEEFDSSSKASICRGSRNYNERYVTEQIEGLDL